MPSAEEAVVAILVEAARTRNQLLHLTVAALRSQVNGVAHSRSNSHPPSAAIASDRLLNGPITSQPDGPVSDHQKPSVSDSKWLARVIVSRPSSRRSSASS